MPSPVVSPQPASPSPPSSPHKRPPPSSSRSPPSPTPPTFRRPPPRPLHAPPTSPLPKATSPPPTPTSPSKSPPLTKWLHPPPSPRSSPLIPASPVPPRRSPLMYVWACLQLIVVSLFYSTPTVTSSCGRPVQAPPTPATSHRLGHLPLFPSGTEPERLWKLQGCGALSLLLHALALAEQAALHLPALIECSQAT